MTELRRSLQLLPLALFFAAFLPTPASAQGWFRLGTHNYDLQIIDENSVVVVGQAGRIVRSDDGGATWVQQRPGVGYDFHSVHFFDPQVGVVVGEVGIAMRTSDGGATWNGTETGVYETLRRIATAGETTLIAVGDDGTIVRSRDQGESWELLAKGTTNGLRSIDMWDASAGIAVGEGGTIIRTTDGGSSWQTMVSTTPVRLNDVLYLSADSVLAVGDRLQTLLSADGGVTWRSVVDSLRGSPTAAYARSSFRRITRIPGGDLLAVGQASNFYNVWRSSNLGGTWIESSTGTSEYTFFPYQAVSFIDAKTGYIAGYGNSMYKTKDGGNSWQAISRLPLQSEPYPDAIHHGVTAQKMFSSRNIATALESTSGGYFRSENSGVTWTHYPTDNRVDFRGMHFFDSANGRAVTPYRQMLTTTDGGRNWWITSQPGIPGTVQYGWYGMAYHGPGLGLVHAYGPEGAYLYYTTDSSQTWSKATIDQPIVSFHDVAYTDDGRAVATGWTGAQFQPRLTHRVFTSADSGATWQMVFETLENIGGIAIIDSRKWLVALASGGFLRTRDAGQTWDAIRISNMGYISGARFFNATDGYAYGQGIWRTHDAGETWQREDLAEAGFPDGRSGLRLLGIELSPDRRALVASGIGYLLRKDLAEPIPLPAASAPDRVKSPGRLRLAVMPNPVRDAAVLRIVGMRDQGALQGTLYVYDALGRTVADLSGELRRGSDGTTIEIELPVDRLRSGSYSVRGVVGGESVQGMFVVAK